MLWLKYKLHSAVLPPPLLGFLTLSKYSVPLKLKLICNRQSGAHLGPVTDFSFSLKFPLDSCGFVIL
jgi:hypothetical protein